MPLNGDNAWIDDLLSQTSDWYWEQDADFRYTYFSDGYYAMGGLPREAVVGTTRWEQETLNMNAGDWARHRAQLEAHERFHGLELHIRRSDGRRRWVSVSGVPAFDAGGRFTGYRGFSRDITTRYLAQEALADKERERSHLLDSIPAIVARVDPDERYTYANIQFCAAYRLTRAKVIGSTMLEVLGPKTRAQMAGLLPRVAGGEAVEYERELRDERGQLREFRVYLAPDLDSAGKVLGYYIFAIDITETRSQARRAEALLAQLTKANSELESFAYTVSHDLRSPLRAIGGFATLLGRDAAGSLDAQAQRQLGRIADNAERMTQLIDGLLRLSQIARHTLARASTSPDELIDEILTEHEAQLAARAIRLQRNPLPRCEADPVLLRRVFANLIDNAIKYTSKREDAEIEIGAIDEGGRTAYFVRDNGAGFDPRYADKLFGVFQRLHGEEEFPGTGIGLATVQRIIERHGGRIRAEGALDRGATFTFTLGD